MQQSLDDTIVAVATPSGVGGLAVLRLSGSKCIDILRKSIPESKVFHPFRATYSSFKNPTTSEEIDEIVYTYFAGPRSYTAEDVIEISCHGGRYVAQQVLETLIESGARMAEPGEFTKRAFLNGRIDLTQAEAVADLIESQTASSHTLAMKQLTGRLKEHVAAIRQRLIDTISLLELELDFSEEEISRTSYDEIHSAIDQIQHDCRELITTFNLGRIFRRGIFVPIVGQPNVGKSSILNALLHEDRALVSETPGTTRDTIHESISHDGVEICLVDTAGLRRSDDTVESMGISRTEEAMKDADVLLHVIDITDPGMATLFTNRVPTITVYNKTDLVESFPESQPTGESPAVYTSALTGKGVRKIGDAIVDTVMGNAGRAEAEETPTIAHERHKNALEQTVLALDRAQGSAKERLSSEFIVVDLRAALDSLGQITGETTTDEILNNIFSKFCIGK